MRCQIGCALALLVLLWAPLPCGAAEWALTTGTDTYDDPEWCDKYITFYSDRDPSVSHDIWVIELDASAHAVDEWYPRVTQTPTADDRAPTWEEGACGTFVYFQRSEGADPIQVFGKSVSGTSTVDGTIGSANDQAPDRSSGEMLVYSDRNGNNDIVAINHGGEKLGWRPVTTSPADDIDPCWSPDGQWVAFASDRSGNYDIWVAIASGEDDSLRQVTDTPEDETEPAWSPTGEFIAFAREGAGIFAAGARGRVEYQVTEDGSDGSPTWSDDASMLAFSRSIGGGRNIWVTDNLPESPVEPMSWGTIKAMYR